VDEPIFISYRTEKSIPREGLLGDILRFVSTRPTLAGFVAGVFGNAIAFLRSPGVLQSAPLEAALLGGGVLLVTTILVSRMGPFFKSLTVSSLDVVRAISFDGKTLLWIEGDDTLRAIDQPRFELQAAEVPESVKNDERAADQLWDVTLKISNDDVALRIATRLSASESAHFHPEDRADTDETLPPHVLAPFLFIARQQAPVSSDLIGSDQVP